MSSREDPPGAVTAPRSDAAARSAGGRKRRRTMAVAGAAGLAAVVGVGAALLATRDDAEPQDTGAMVATSRVPTAPTAQIDAVPGAEVAPPGPSRAAVPRTPAPRPATQMPERVRKEIEQAREKAARDGYPLQRPLTTPPGMAAQNTESYTEQTRPLIDGGTMRIISARYDLSGQREMLWAADQGKPAGAARCTQNFRFAQNDKPAVRPTMLLCWRITDDRSVVVLSVAPNGRPAQTQTLNALDTQWDRLG